MRRSRSAPAAGDWQEYLRQLPDEVSLQFWSEHQVAVALLDCGKRGEDAASYAEVDRADMRSFFGSFEAQSDAAEIGGSQHDLRPQLVQPLAKAPKHFQQRALRAERSGRKCEDEHEQCESGEPAPSAADFRPFSHDGMTHPADSEENGPDQPSSPEVNRHWNQGKNG